MKQIPLNTLKPYFIDKNGNVEGIKSWLHHSINGKEYRRVRLYLVNGKPKMFYVHRLVALTFIGEIGKNIVCHKNDIGIDNRFENIKICTVKENQTTDRISNGTYFNRGYCPF